MNATDKLPTIEVNPASVVKKSIIWMHGLGADGNDFAPIVPEFRLPPTLGVRFIFPHAPIMPVTLNNGYEMRAWFDIHSPELHINIDYEGIERSIQAINTLIRHEISRGITPDNIMLAGFSQGAVMSLATGLLFPDRLAGVIALSGLLPQVEAITAKSLHRDLPIFIAHGTQDQIVPFALGNAASDGLIHAGYPVSWHSYPMPHTVCSKEISDISNWIQHIWK
jgi:phospholipase/carboxylesterase